MKKRKEYDILQIDKRIKQVTDRKYYDILINSFKTLEQPNIINEFLIEDSKEWLQAYADVIDKIIDLVNEKEFNQKTYEYYILKIVLMNDTINYYNKLYKNINRKLKININYNLSFNFQILNKYLLFAFRSNKRVETSYENSILSKIDEEAIKINELMKKINLIKFNKTKKEFFKYGQETVDLAANIRSITEDETSLNILINYLYKGIYESSCDSNQCKIYTDFPNIDTFALDLIKKYRGFFDHELRNNTKKLTTVMEFNESIISKSLPDKKPDYVKIQYNMYIKIREMLESIYTELNSNN